jgi:HEAT repeat protein
VEALERVVSMALSNPGSDACIYLDQVTRALGRLGDGRAVQPLCSVLHATLKNENWCIPRSSATQSAYLAEKVASGELTTEVRALDAIALALPRMYAETGREVMYSTIVALGKLGDHSSIPLLKAALSKQYLNVRWAAFHALLRFGAFGDKPIAWLDDAIR